MIRDCQHPQSRHEHGTRNAYVRDGCRCDRCRAANTAAERARNRAKAYGRYQGYVDAAPVREHILALSAAGVGLKTITVRTGVSGGQLCSILYGRGRRGNSPRRPQRKVMPEVRDRIFAVPLDAEPAPGTRVDPTGTRRRLEALVALGWSQAQLAERLGMARANFGKTLRAEHVLKSTADRVRALFDELWDATPPASTHRQKIAVARSRRIAAERGWLPPLAWDDDTIDDPDAQPLDNPVAGDEPDGHDVDEIAVERLMHGTLRLPPNSRAPELVEAVTRLAAQGLSDWQIGQRVGRTSGAVYKLRERYEIPSAVAA